MSTPRLCACGCGVSLVGMKPQAIYASPACKTRVWRRSRQEAGQTRRVPVQRRRSGGAQVSFRRAVAVLAREFPSEPVERFERVLAGALSERQRRELVRLEVSS